MARWFGLTPRPAAPDSDLDWPGDITPESHPGLSAEMCAILNTPLEDCDPELLRAVLAAFAKQLAAALPPDPERPDAAQLFSALWERLGRLVGDAHLEAPQDAAPELPCETDYGTWLPQGPDLLAADPFLPHAPVAPASVEWNVLALELPVAAQAMIRVSRTGETGAAPPAIHLEPHRPRLGRATSCFPQLAAAAFRHHRATPGGDASDRATRAGLLRLPARRLCYAACAGPP